MVGRHIGRFRILSLLGRGGMGSVWKAEDTLLGRAVAIKCLSEDLARSEESRRRFRREGEISARLDHPGICPVYDAGEQDGLTYLVMAWIDGDTLSERIRERLMPVEDVLRAGRMAAEALHHAHGQGVVHRDVTSRNIMIARDGRVVLLDFGLAIVSDASRITGPGALVGTIAYMAPELLCGQNATAQSDVYSLGVVLYEILTGARPFQSDHTEVLRYKVLNEQAESPCVLRPEIPPALDAVVRRAMSRAVEARYAHADELRAALLACEERVGANDPAPQDASAPEVRMTASGASTDMAPWPGPATPRGVTDAGLRLAARTQPVYLAILAAEDTDPTPEPKRGRILADMIETAGAALGELDRVRVVSAISSDPPHDLRAWARRAGANLVLRTRARVDGVALRVTFALLDPETGASLAGGTVDGSLMDPFRLEDQFVEAVAVALGRPSSNGATRARRRDPGARDRFQLALSNLRRIDHEASLEGAIALLEGLIASEGESAPLLGALTRACLAKHRLTQHRQWEARALRACERARFLDPAAPETLLALAETHLLTGRLPSALLELERIPPGHELEYEALLVRARTLDAMDRSAEAEAEARVALEQRPQDWRGHHVLGLVLFRVGRYVAAADAWSEVVRQCPDNAGAHRNLGSVLYHLDRPEAAIQAFRRANELRPDVKAYYGLGTVLFRVGRYAEAVDAFESAVALNPLDALAWGNLGNACHFIPGLEPREREALEHAIALMRTRMNSVSAVAEDWARLAGWLANLGRRDEAEASLERSLAMSPGDVHCMVAAAGIYLQVGDRSRSLEWIQRAVAAGYGVEMLRASREMEPLRGDRKFERIIESAANHPGDERRANPETGGRE